MTSDRIGLWLLMVGTGACVVLFVLLVLRMQIDYGECLASHREPRHTDAYMTVACNFDGVCLPEWHDAEDWMVTVCDRWEFPHGRAERPDARVQ